MPKTGALLHSPYIWRHPLPVVLFCRHRSDQALLSFREVLGMYYFSELDAKCSELSNLTRLFPCISPRNIWPEEIHLQSALIKK